ncbi:MAG: ECF transporter S component [Clostridiales bacterium]|nr:ECF transporter S component [Clostridiales bacterium]
MQKKSISRTLISVIAVIIFVPAAILIGWYMGDRQYYITGVIIIILSMVPFFVGFENRKPQARELVCIAVMCAIAVASRVAFIMVPHFKPIIGIIIIAGMAFGPAAGFLTGSISAFVSNFIFGQGPWTPWQMFSYGLAGFIAGLLTKAGVLKPEKRIPVTIFGGLIIMLIVGPLLDTCTVFTMASMVNTVSLAAVYLAGVPVNTVLAVCTMLTLLLLCKPMTEKLNRIKVKYGMMEED